MSVRVLLIVRAHESLRVQESLELVRVHVFARVNNWSTRRHLTKVLLPSIVLVRARSFECACVSRHARVGRRARQVVLVHWIDRAALWFYLSLAPQRKEDRPASEEQ